MPGVLIAGLVALFASTCASGQSVRSIDRCHHVTTEYEPVLDAYFKEARGSEGPGVVLRVYGGRLPEYEIVVNTQISRHSIFRYYPRAIDLGERLQPRETTSKFESVQNGGAQNSFLKNGSRSAGRRIARTYCASEQDRYFNLRASPAQGFRGSRISATGRAVVRNHHHRGRKSCKSNGHRRLPHNQPKSCPAAVGTRFAKSVRDAMILLPKSLLGRCYNKKLSSCLLSA